MIYFNPCSQFPKHVVGTIISDILIKARKEKVFSLRLCWCKITLTQWVHVLFGYIEVQISLIDPLIIKVWGTEAL